MKRLLAFRLAIIALVITAIQMTVLVPVMSRLSAGKTLGPVYVRADVEAGEQSYTQNCAACHGGDGKGNPAMESTMKGLDIRPALSGSPEAMEHAMREGKGAMPPFKSLNDEQVRQLLAYLLRLGERQ